MSGTPLTADSVESQADDESAGFDDLVRPLIVPVHNYLRRRVNSPTDADDCLSDVLLALWRHRQRLPAPPDEARLWAFGIAKGVLANHRRSQRRRDALHTRIADEQRTSAEPAEVDATSRVSEVLEKLKPADRELIILVAWDGLGVAEAGSLLGLSASAARSRHSRLRARIRVELRGPTGG